MTNGTTIDVNGRPVFIPDSVLREQQVKDSQSIELIAHKVSRLATDMSDLASAQRRMSESITALVRIEERQTTTTIRIDDIAKTAAEKEIRLRVLEKEIPDHLNARLSAIETKMPGLVESRLWLIAGGLGVLALVGKALAAFIFK